ncbi:MAG: Eco57I restriction-modification methylase [Promethearchaeota archaeon]|nr:MAG: Eco57I restriction-modification methylase [Candidatus Lokiarchaeota archaeon]
MKNEGIGQVFTPDYIAKFMVSNLLNLYQRFNNIKIDSLRFNLEVIEPSVGDGIFLKYLIQQPNLHITAFEIDKTFEKSLKKTYPEVSFRFENFLNSSLEKKYDLIIGNPPYLGQNYNAELFQDYCKRFPICKKYFVGNMDLFYYWIHLGIEKLKPGGFLSYITTNYWLSKSQKTGIKYLKPHILKETFLLQYIDLSQLSIFNKATGQHNCIFVLQKKNNLDKQNKNDEDIHIIKLQNNKPSDLTHNEYNQKMFEELLKGKQNESIQRYKSSITNNQLIPEGNWNLLYPREINEIMEKIKDKCRRNGKIIRLKDYYIIRNGLIFVKDSIFILKEGKDITHEKNKICIRYKGELVIVPENEKKVLKKVYKSKSIIPYGYKKEDIYGYAIFFNKNEFKEETSPEKIKELEKTYPILSKYIKQYKDNLREILRNARENPNDFYFPRRGNFIHIKNYQGKRIKFDLEPKYESSEKIFFKYIMADNTFGYASEGDAYFGTSDTYFIWSRNFEDQVYDYPFLVSYLNSRLVHFIFKAQNIKIKRSKTQLERKLYLPNLSAFDSERDKSLVSLIRNLSSFVMLLMNGYGKISEDLIQLKENINETLKKVKLSGAPSKTNIKKALQQKKISSIKHLIDSLFFELFDLYGDRINALLEEYYE